MSDIREAKAAKLMQRVELICAYKEASMKEFDSEDARHRSVFPLGGILHACMRDATTRRDGKPSIAERVAIRRGLMQPIVE